MILTGGGLEKMLCQHCKKQTATVHLTDLVKGEKRERHLCEACAAQEGVIVKQHVSVPELLNSFLASQPGIQELARLRCPDCGMTFMEFRSQGLLGCPNDYEVFGDHLSAVIERAQEGRTHHTGRGPGEPVELNSVDRERMELQRELHDAVENEDYERAAQLRDRLSELRRK
ncbi:MAG: UvrB/UvrC motif-containing protein [Phycisphaerae bacterium]